VVRPRLTSLRFSTASMQLFLSLPGTGRLWRHGGTAGSPGADQLRLVTTPGYASSRTGCCGSLLGFEPNARAGSDFLFSKDSDFRRRANDGNLRRPWIPIRVSTVVLHRPNPVARETPGFIGVFARRGQVAEREGFSPPLVFDLARLPQAIAPVAMFIGSPARTSCYQPTAHIARLKLSNKFCRTRVS
jgi:hypothetical protein